MPSIMLLILFINISMALCDALESHLKGRAGAVGKQVAG